MTPFEHPLHATTADIDELGHVNNVVYVRWVQEVAAQHWKSVATPELKAQYMWVVLRHEIDYKNPSFAGDEITGMTWVGEHHGARFDRYVKLFSKTNGKIFAEAKTNWCLLDRRSSKPVRIPLSILALL
jgi:acyl-CoA thioester hydrolase